MGIEFEYTARNTPQQNSFTEVAIATMSNRGRAMMNRANVPEKYRYVLFKYAVTTATKLDMLLVVEIDGSTAMRSLHWAGTVPRFSKHLRTWEETGTVTTKIV